ncbi:FAD dependent oxidoreductase-domain-containing protein [Fusarium oxysporum II5]|uniref:FAD dependent oxidoreductase domain-containing protein n=2 Tax=Fusarium oxysporum species complex TaxID=171631 RepID=X0KS25_FUSO5|nr:uncharacterized protein FOIG_01186 [Fusarium odoratissimum NRRL 54006]EXM11582.1 hypothetical protein FOIG_01186 [Fusarium odoratissimum NRRL 54006]KAK2136801.1 FAD dependent oxidoreductase-domain-containing protein [Fusarium oxysporum II5]TXC05014.1 hypothetical protein FocTR4_00000967 [Fusarium oxysporum f. sp. cubense]
MSLDSGTQFTSSNLEKAMDHGRPALSPASFPLTPNDAKCYWIENFPISLDDRFASAPLPEEVDVAIIGSGITGAAAAYRLSQKQPELRVAVLEARSLCSGATGRNGGHIGRPEVYGYRELAKTFGTEDALRMRKMVLKNRDMMIECISQLDAAEKVDLRLNGTMVVFASQEERQKFEDDLNYAREQGYEEECRILSPEEILQKISITSEAAQHGAAYLENCGTMYPRKFVNVLFEAALERMPALSLHPNTPVSQVSCVTIDSTQHYRITTSTEKVVNAKVVLHATNGYANNLLPALRGKKGVVGCMAHMLGVQPPKIASTQLDQGFGYADFWHWIQQAPQGGPFLYGLATAERMNYYDDSQTIPDDDPVKKEMLRFLKQTFGKWFPGVEVEPYVKYDWTGIQGFTVNGASIVGRPNKDSLGEFISVGHNGEGMTRCFTCSTVVTDMMLSFLGGENGFQIPEWFPKAFVRDLAGIGKLDYS